MSTVIGIDLGTTNTVVAVGEERPRVLSTRMNEDTTPSVVGYYKRRNKPGSLVIGRAAVNNAIKAPGDTVFSIKRLMGRRADDEQVTRVEQHFSFGLEADPKSGAVRVRIADETYSPTEISTMILRQAVEDASKALGRPVETAVITVPAYFSEAQRAATRQAGIDAGLQVKRIIDEPTAAAIAFGMERSGERHRILVFDLGGGTFDVSLIQAAGDQFETLGLQGDMWLGGDDFDQLVAQEIIEWVKTEFEHDPSDDARFMRLARQNAEQAKIALTAQEAFEIAIPAALRTPDGDFVDIDFEITRERFESLISPSVNRLMALVDVTLSGQGLSPADLTSVLLVGGSTAVPMIYDRVVEYFGPDKVRRTDPMHCVALGAAILASRLDGVECPSCGTVCSEDAKTCTQCNASLAVARSSGSIGLGEVTARNLGIRAVQSMNETDVFAVIIPKGTPYPLKRPMSRTFYTTSENRIRVPVFEGEGDTTRGLEFQGVIDHELPADVPPNTPVTVEFNYDRDRVLTVGLRVHGRAELDHDQVLSRDQPASEKVDDGKWKDELKSIANTADYFIEQFREFLDANTAKKMQGDIIKARTAFSAGDRKGGERIAQALRMTMLGSGVASRLFLADRAMESASRDSRETLKQASRQLKEAHRRGDRHRVTRISQALQIAVAREFQERSRREGGASKDLDGLLREGIN